MKLHFLIVFIFLLIVHSQSRGAQPDSTGVKSIQDYQIALPHPAKEIKLLLYDKNFLPIQGKLSEDKKAVILKNYQQGNKVRVKVVYEDGTEEEILKSPCYIDPVVL
ncbi:MAG TPA: hypothetical protein PLU53_10880 [Bacteroidia bacterium]|nr:hypothetical protein [Bacteroidia bacterium]